MKKQKNRTLILTAAVACTSLAIFCSALHTLDQKIERLESTAAELSEMTRSVKVTVTPTTAEPETELTTAEPETEPETKAPDVRTKNIELIGRTIWGEAGGVESTAERAAVAWCILNRVDATGKTIEEVVTAPSQFYGYRAEGDVPEEHLELAEDVLARWEAEKNGTCASGRTLPAGYLYFTGDGQRNHFTKTWGGTDYWTWSLPNPY